MPIISIVVPVYKVENYLCRCIESVLCQTFIDFELILVDDGSPDNCGNICEEYAKKDNRIHVIHKKNGGLSDARNFGIMWILYNSTSDWVTFLDSDDWIHPQYLEKLYYAAKNNGMKISVCSFVKTSEHNISSKKIEITEKIVDTESFFCQKNINAVVAWGKLYKKLLFTSIKYPYGKLHEDEFTTYKILFKYDKIAFIEQPLYYYFYNENSITSGQWTPKRLDALEAYLLQMCFFRKHDFDKAFIISSRNFKETLFEYIEIIENNDEYKEYMKHIRKYMRKFLRKYAKDNKISVKTHPHYYEIGYPVVMKFYWDCKVLKNKFIRK